MRKWGFVISVFYAVIVFGLLVPAAAILAGDDHPLWRIFSKDLIAVCSDWLCWLPIVAVLAGQTILLFLSVDTSFKKSKPRAHIALSVTVGAMLFALLSFAVVYCVGFAVQGEKFQLGPADDLLGVIAIWLALWVAWGIVFYLYFRNVSDVTTRIVSWLLKGSVLELLIAVPCHVIVRRRDECSAPIFTSFGIVTGIAVMLLSFGPSVLLLYKKRLDAYSTRPQAPAAH
jgi:hypothetical protein